MSFIGIDLGATFLKAAWLDTGNNALGECIREPFPDFQEGLLPNRREVSPKEVLSSVKRLIKQLLQLYRGNCDGLLLCGQMHGFVLTNSSGEIFSNFISWQDMRCQELGYDGKSHFEVAKNNLGNGLIGRLGNEFRPGLPAATLHALQRIGELPSGLIPISLADYVAVQITGGRAVTHSSNAAAHGLFDIPSGCWSGEALRELGLGKLQMPEIQDFSEPVGCCRIGRLEFPVFTPVGDQQAALFGVGLIPGEISLNIATGSQVSRICNAPVIGDWQLRPYFNNQWLRTVTHLPAGRALNRLVALFGELADDQGTPLQDVWAQISRLSEAAKPQHLRVNLSFFPSAFGSEGSIDHVREDELDVGSIFKASFQAMAENYFRAARIISKEEWTGVVFSGGLARKTPMLRSEIIRRFECDHRLAVHEEDTLMGLVSLARLIEAKK